MLRSFQTHETHELAWRQSRSERTCALMKPDYHFHSVGKRAETAGLCYLSTLKCSASVLRNVCEKFPCIFKFFFLMLAGKTIQN